MRDYIDVTGKTEEEAIQKALDQLGLDRDDVSVEILKRAKTGFLGIGSTPAEVRIRYGEDKPDSVPALSTAPSDSLTSGTVRHSTFSTAKTADAMSYKNSSEPAPDNTPAYNGNGSPDTTADVDSGGGTVSAGNPAPADAGREEIPEPSKSSRKRDKIQRERKGKRSGQRKDRNPDSSAADAQMQPSTPDESAVPARKNKSRQHDDEPSPDAPAQDTSAQEDTSGQNPATPSGSLQKVDDEKAQAIREYLSGLLSRMDQQADIQIYLDDAGRYKVNLIPSGGESGHSGGMGALIGRRGETLDAIQQLTNYSVNRNGNRVRIQLDAEGYREKREQSLRTLARREAAKVVKYRRSRTLEPMNAYERHVIHTALQEYRGVTTYSTGVDPNRRVIIAYDKESL